MASLCYAHVLGGCGGNRRSGEHYLSKSVLLQLGEELVATGLPWLGGAPRESR